MKKILSLIIILITVSITTVPVHAETFAEKCQRMQAENDRQFLEGLAKDGNLTEEALTASKTKTNLKPNKKTDKKNKNNSTSTTSTYSGESRGWVYSTDELHITGLPEDAETGYTKAGDYGIIY